MAKRYLLLLILWLTTTDFSSHLQYTTVHTKTLMIPTKMLRTLTLTTKINGW